MAVRTFVFCDVCNISGYRSIEMRRSLRENQREGRRCSDGRSWLEGGESNAIEQGWVVNMEGKHICPLCQKPSHSID